MMDHHVEYCDVLSDRFNGIPTRKQLIETLKRTDPPWKRCSAVVVYSDGDPLRPNELARAQPNAPRGWDKFTVYVRPMLRDDPKTELFALAHELAHVAFGQIVTEDECDEFASRLVKMSVEEYRERKRSYKSKLSRLEA